MAVHALGNAGGIPEVPTSPDVTTQQSWPSQPGQDLTSEGEVGRTSSAGPS